MKIKQCVVGALLGIMASTVAAQSITFPVGEGTAWLGATMGTSSNLYQMNHEMTGNQEAGTYPHSHSWFTDIGLSDFKVVVGYDSEVAGGKVTVRGPSNWRPNAAFSASQIFSDSYAWVKFGDYVKVQGGWYEYRRMNGLNSVVGNFNYGYIKAAEGKSGDTGSLTEVDLFKNLIAEFYIPAGEIPVTLEFSPITINSVEIGGSNTLAVNDIMQNPDVWNFAGGFRASAPLLDDQLKVQLMYAPAVSSSEGVFDGDPTADRPKTLTYKDVFAAGAELYLLPDTELAVMFSGTHTSTLREWVEEDGTKAGDNTLSDVYWALDVRGRYVGLPKTTLEAHLKGTFGHEIGKQPASTSVPYTFGGFWGAIGGGYQLTDELSLRLVADGRYTLRWGEQERNEAMRLEVKPAVRYNLTDKISAQAGVTYAMQIGRGIDATGNAVESTMAQSVAVPISLFIEL